MRQLLILIFALTFFFPVTAANLDLQSSFRFKSYNTESGLPGATVKCIYQTNNGLTWLGVEYAGIASFDGENFDLFSNNPHDSLSLSSNFVKDIIEDRDGNLWIATDEGLNKKNIGITSMHFNTFERFYSKPDSNSLPDNDIICLFNDLNSNLLIGTDKGLCRYIGDNRFCRIPLNNIPQNEPEVQALYQIKNAGIYVGTSDGLFLLDTNYKVIYHWEIEYKHSFLDLNVTSICEDKEGKLWVGSRRGIYIHTPGTKNLVEINNLVENKLFPSIGITSIQTDSQGRMWIGTYDAGLFIFVDGYNYISLNSGKLDQSNQIGFQIRDIYIDAQGLIWIGSKNVGVNIFNSKVETFSFAGKHTNAGFNLNDNSILSIYEDKSKNLLIGTRHGGLNIYNPQKGTMLYYQHEKENNSTIINNRIESIQQDKFGDYWIGSVSGLSRLDKQSGGVENYMYVPVRAIAVDSNNTIWLGTRLGLAKFNRQSNKIEKVPLEEASSAAASYIYALRVSSDNHLWIGTAKNGLIDYNVDRGKTKWYHEDQKDNSKTINNCIRSIYEDKQGNFWFGTKEKGLYFLNRQTEGIKPIINDLQTKAVFAILEDNKQNLWISSNNGIYKYNRSDGSLDRYGKEYGLQGETFIHTAFCKTSDNILFFGGNNGLNFFNPDNITKKVFTPSSAIKTVYTHRNKPLFKNNNNEYVFRHDDHISFEFFLNDYSAPQKSSYKYRISGLSEEWIDCGHHMQVSYANLKPGKYKFSVKGKNVDLVSSLNTAEVDFIVKPPWWNSNVARIVYLLIFIGLFFASYRIITFRSRKQHELEMLKLEKEQTERLTEYKLRFFTNISHELRTPLTIILPSVEKLIGTKNVGRDEISKYAGSIYHNTKKLINLVEELVEFRKVEKGQWKLNPVPTAVNKFSQELFSALEPLAKEKDISYEYYPLHEEQFVFLDKKVCSKILNNLITNAIKYTPEAGRVICIVDVLNNNISKKAHLQFTIKDTGMGISKQSIKNIFNRFYRSERDEQIYNGVGIGLDLVKSLVELHSGDIYVESTPGKGSTFKVKLNLTKTEREIVENDEDKLQLQSGTNLHVKDHQADTVLNPSAKKRLLIVEDDTEILNLIIDILSVDYRIQTAKNGLEGVRMAGVQPQPDIIISDIMMPGKNGLELCAELKEHHKTSHIPIVLLTAKSEIEDKIRGLKTGADEYISKPFHADYLKLKIDAIIKNKERLTKYYNTELQLEPTPPQQTLSQDEELLSKCVQIIEDNMDNPDFSVTDLSDIIGISRTNLFRKLKSSIGQGPQELIYSTKLKKAVSLLKLKKYTISEIAYRTGFSSPSSFSTTFKKSYGSTPKDFQKELN